MQRFLNKVHLPIAGVMLAFATLGNILAEYGSIYKNICGLISCLLLILLIIKLIFQFSSCKKAFENPLAATSFATFDMGIMVLSTYLKPSSPLIAKYIWFVAIAIHICLIVYVLVKFVVSFSFHKIFASFFVAFVGIVIASVTAPAFGMIALGRVIFYTGFVLYLCLIPVIFFRLVKHNDFHDDVKPSNAIIAAPASLCLAGYLSSFESASPGFVFFLAIISFVMTLIGYFFFINTNKKAFYPSYAGYTFPFVISALAMKKFAAFASKITFEWSSQVNNVATIELIIAILVCVYVLVRYIISLLKKDNS